MVRSTDSTDFPVNHDEAFNTNVMDAFYMVMSDLSGEDPGSLIDDKIRDVVMRSIVDLANSGQVDLGRLRYFGFSQGCNFVKNRRKRARRARRPKS